MLAGISHPKWVQSQPLVKCFTLENELTGSEFSVSGGTRPTLLGPPPNISVHRLKP